MSTWNPVAELDTDRRNRCRIRLISGEELEALWAPYEARNGEVLIGWVCSDETIRALNEVAEYQLLASLPIGSLPLGGATNEELVLNSTVPNRFPKLIDAVEGDHV